MVKGMRPYLRQTFRSLQRRQLPPLPSFRGMPRPTQERLERLVTISELQRLRELPPLPPDTRNAAQ